MKELRLHRKKCRDERAEHAALVAAGGVHFRCRTCKAEGVIRPDVELAKQVRRALKIEAPEPCAVEMETCPACDEQEKESDIDKRQSNGDDADAAKEAT